MIDGFVVAIAMIGVSGCEAAPGRGRP